MDALATLLEQAGPGVLRQPVDMQARMQPAQFAGDGNVAAAVPEADRRGKVEHLLLPRRAADRRLGRAEAQPAVEKVVDQSVALGGNAAERIVATISNGHELGAGELGHELAARMGLDLVVVAMDRQHRTADLAIHRLADVDRSHRGALFHWLDEPRTV